MLIVFSAIIFDRWSDSGLSRTLHASAKTVHIARVSAKVDSNGILGLGVGSSGFMEISYFKEAL